MGRVPEAGWGAKGPETLDFYTAQEKYLLHLNTVYF
jgi:hypothetical protein